MLQELLVSFLQQISGRWDEQVQICISDNASTDETEHMVAELMGIYPDVEILFFKNEENKGLDQNCIACIQRCNAEYAWIFGSDDVAYENAVDYVINAITRFSDADLLIGRREVCTFGLKHLYYERWCAKRFENLVIPFSDPNAVCPLLDSLNSTTALFGYLSTKIVRKATWEMGKDYSSYYNSLYAHVYMDLYYLVRGGRLVYFDQYIAKSRAGNDDILGKLEQRIVVDLDAYSAFADLIPVAMIRNSFMGVIRRHYNNVFLGVMGLANQKDRERNLKLLSKLEYSGYSKGLIKEKPRIVLYFQIFIAAIYFLLRSPIIFLQTCLKTIEKMKKHERHFDWM